MRSVNPEEAGIRHMLPKARHHLVKIEQVRRPVAHVLKEAFLAQGGDAVISREMITAKADYSSVILMGTRKQYAGASNNLREQGFGCDALAEEIEIAIRRAYSIPEHPEAAQTDDTRLGPVWEAMGRRTLVMGVLNVTPDSFSDRGRYFDADAAVARAVQMAGDGADVIDLGGESSRPGAEPVSAEDETGRVVPVISELVQRIGVPISIDTTKADVARAALDAGASIVNDISGASFDPDMPTVIAERGCPAVLMHIKGTPRDMQHQPAYEDLMGEICGYLRARIAALVEAGVDERVLMVDPGIGFGKTVEHNLEILRRLRELKSMGRPILVGTSRKSTIGKVLGDLPADQRMEGTAATVAIAIANGGDVVRVHDVKEMARVSRMADAIVRDTDTF
jgi:dihydropteroate synthase